MNIVISKSVAALGWLHRFCLGVLVEAEVVVADVDGVIVEDARQVMVWYGGNFTSDAWWKNAMTNAYVITRDQLPDLK